MMTEKPKKFKISKDFKPLSAEEGDEFFANGMFEFNVTRLLAFVRDNLSKFPVEEVNVRQWAIWGSIHLNEATIENVNLAIPIILAEISPGRFNVIDGNHRLEKAHRHGMEKISAHKVRADQHIAFLKSEKAYRAYIKYWNSKVDDWGG